VTAICVFLTSAFGAVTALFSFTHASGSKCHESLVDIVESSNQFHENPQPIPSKSTTARYCEVAKLAGIQNIIFRVAISILSIAAMIAFLGLRANKPWAKKLSLAWAWSAVIITIIESVIEFVSIPGKLDALHQISPNANLILTWFPIEHQIHSLVGRDLTAYISLQTIIGLSLLVLPIYITRKIKLS
jgi:hypothetical protein